MHTQGAKQLERTDYNIIYLQQAFHTFVMFYQWCIDITIQQNGSSKNKDVVVVKTLLSKIAKLPNLLVWAL